MTTVQRPARRWLVREWLVTAAVVAAAVIGYYVLPMRGRFWPLAAVAGPLAILGVALLAVRHVRRILSSERPLHAVAVALVAMLTVLILGFATTYFTIQTHAPEQMAGLETKTDALYFTVTVMTTVGFGDITPVGQLSRGVATFHMLSNLIVLGVTARLVLWAASKRVEDGPRPDLAKKPRRSRGS